MRSKKLARTAGVMFLIGSLAACSGGSGSAGSQEGPVTLSFWSWVPNIDKVVATWNSSHPDIQVEVSKPAQGDALTTKILAADKAGNPPDLMQAEYQTLPTLVTNGVVADVTSHLESVRGQFSDTVWSQVTFGDKRYGVPQDIGPMMFFYRKDLFAKYDLLVPTTWAEYAATAEAVHAKDPEVHLGGFSAADPGWFTGLVSQAGGSWWSFDGTSWGVRADDAAGTKVADFWDGLVREGSIDSSAWWTPEWNSELDQGKILSWVSAVWAPGVLSGSAPRTGGKWAAAPLPQWRSGENVTGFWGGSSTAVAARSKHVAAAAQFAQWLNTDPAGVKGLIAQGSVYPASTSGQSSPALSETPEILSADQADFYTRAEKIAAGARAFTWGPNVNVAYSAFNDAFGKAVQNRTACSAGLRSIQTAVVADMKKSGFTISGR
jgi:multiple sugar transport system substrate-binding protein